MLCIYARINTIIFIIAPSPTWLQWLYNYMVYHRWRISFLPLIDTNYAIVGNACRYTTPGLARKNAGTSRVDFLHVIILKSKPSPAGVALRHGWVSPVHAYCLLYYSTCHQSLWRIMGREWHERKSHHPSDKFIYDTRRITDTTHITLLRVTVIKTVMLEAALCDFSTVFHPIADTRQ